MPGAARAADRGARLRRRLTGGDLAETWQVDDRVEKTYAQPHLAETEAAGLGWLAVDGGPPVPRVHGADAHRLTIDYVPEGRPTRQGAEELGRALARLHATPAGAWGATPSGRAYVGTLEVSVGEHPSWALLWRARTAALLAHLPGVDHRPYDRVHLDDVPTDGARRVHGDLWSGNVLWDARGTAWLIDPAAHGGHPELDVAMLALFGAPHLDALVGAWAEVAQPADGWRERLPLHQVHPLLFHAVAFGGGYLARATQAVARAGDRARPGRVTP